jgi:septal ring factor EnvC (AmiA/AmiB activator)
VYLAQYDVETMTKKEDVNKKSTDLALAFTQWIGTPMSIFIHTLLFIAAFIFVLFGAPLDSVLLILTTIVSLEAIYLSLFIQLTVNENTKSLEGVEEDIDEIQEDFEDLEEDFGEVQEDVEALEGNVAEISKNVEGLEDDIEEISEDIEELNPEEGDVTKAEVPASSIKTIEKELLVLSKSLLALQKDISELRKNSSIKK